MELTRTRKKRITTSSAKAKGRNLQQWACRQISKILNIPWGKDEMIASREGSQNGTDIRLVGVAKKLFPFSVECKWQESWALPAWIKQAKSNQDPDTDWLLIVKRNHADPIVVMDAERFFELFGDHVVEDIRNEIANSVRKGRNND